MSNTNELFDVLQDRFEKVEARVAALESEISDMESIGFGAIEGEPVAEYGGEPTRDLQEDLDVLLEACRKSIETTYAMHGHPDAVIASVNYVMDLTEVVA